MFRIFVLALLSSLSATLAFAQTTSATTATVMGTVTDQQGGVLPGVSVSLSGSSMMGMQTQVTDSVGLYRFVSIPPGEYKLVFELGGFSTLNREGVRLTAGFTATINTQMGVATLTESVQVTGDSPVVDTQSTSINTTFDKDMLANLPSARDYWAFSRKRRASSWRALTSAAAPRARRRTTSSTARPGRTGRWSKGSTRRKAPDRSATTSTTDRFQKMSIGSGASSAESPVPGVYTVLVSKSGRKPLQRLVLRRLRVEGLAVIQHRQRTIAAGVTGGGGLEPRDVNRLTATAI